MSSCPRLPSHPLSSFPFLTPLSLRCDSITKWTWGHGSQGMRIRASWKQLPSGPLPSCPSLHSPQTDPHMLLPGWGPPLKPEAPESSLADYQAGNCTAGAGKLLPSEWSNRSRQKGRKAITPALKAALLASMLWAQNHGGGGGGLNTYKLLGLLHQFFLHLEFMDEKRKEMLFEFTFPRVIQ